MVALDGSPESEAGLPPAVAPAVNVDMADALLHHALARDAALLILATHARRGLDRLRYGSVESAVVARAALPVLVVRAALPVEQAGVAAGSAAGAAGR